MVRATQEQIQNPKWIEKLIESWEKGARQISYEQEEYYRGKNQKILKRTIAENTQDAPDNKIPIPYGRKIINTIAGYMLRPGYVTTVFNNSALQEKYDEIYKQNKETLKTNQLGTYSSVNGKSYELHYYDQDSKGESLPRFVLVKESNGLAVYDTNIEPKIILFIRAYKIDNEKYYDLYYIDRIESWKFDERIAKFIKADADKPNLYSNIPIVEYKNNYENISDIEPITALIDGYDVLISDSLNEFDRFAWAYLILAGFSLSDEDAKDIKQKRIFETMDSTAQAKFLTKDINHEFIKFMAEWFKREIHRQSFIPDIEDVKFGTGASGIAIDKFIYLMEYIAANKEAYMREAMEDRVKMIADILNIQITEFDFKIDFKRNEPQSKLQDADIYTKYDGRGISRETLMQNFATFVEDPEAELEKFNEEQDQMMDFTEEDEEVEGVTSQEEPEEGEDTE